MAHEIRKKLTVEIEYGSINELKVVFESILGNLAHGKNYERKKVLSAIYELQNEFVCFEPDYRVEEINGKTCIIIKSKI